MSSKFTIAFVILAALLSTACGLPSLRKSGTARTTKQVQPWVPRKAESLDLEFAGDRIKSEIQHLYDANKFDEIEQLAAAARSKRVRLEGGYWKIDSIYEALSTNYAEQPGQELTETRMQSRIEKLEHWKKSNPKSLTARVALAGAIVNYAWFARGNGYIDTVSEGEYAKYKKGLDTAEAELEEAISLGMDCPRLRRDLLFLGMTNGWSEDRFEELFLESIAREPNYLQHYLVKSEHLTPKWNGSVEEWATFVNSIPELLSRNASDEGDLVYFVVLANKVQDKSFSAVWNKLDKERVKNGFRQLGVKYGIDKLRRTQYSYLSFFMGDPDMVNVVSGNNVRDEHSEQG